VPRSVVGCPAMLPLCWSTTLQPLHSEEVVMCRAAWSDVLQCCLSVGPPHCSRCTLRRSSYAAQRGDAVLQCCLSVGPPHCSRCTLRRSSDGGYAARQCCLSVYVGL